MKNVRWRKDAEIQKRNDHPRQARKPHPNYEIGV